MKKVLLMLAAALMLGAVACTPKNPELKPDTSKDPGTDTSKDPETPAEKSKACRILSLSVTSGSVTIEGQIFDEENFIELTYKPEQKFALSNAVAAVEISPKATISPDPATIKDWTAAVKLTVTAEDGTTKKEYSVEPAAQRYIVSLSGDMPEKTADEMGTTHSALFGGNLHAFCSTDKFADAAGNVFDLTLAKVGTLNQEGLGDGVITCMSNDDYGVLIAAVGYANDDWTGTPANCSELVSTKLFAWKDGYDKAPVEIYSNAGNVGQFLNVTGDFAGEMYAFAYNDGREGKHHTWTFHNGSRPSGDEWRWFDTRHVDNRFGDSCGGDMSLEYFYASQVSGNSSGQNVSGLEITPGSDGKPEGGIYFYCSSEPEWDGGTGGSWWRPSGAMCWVRNGIDGEDIAVPGTLDSPDIENPLKHGGPQHYGNTDIPAGIKAFNFSGHHYAAVTHVGVSAVWFTLHNLDYYLGDTTDPQYVQKSMKGLKEPGTHWKPSVAYVFNPARDEGYIVASYLKTPIGDATDSGAYRVYTLTREELK